MTVSFDANDRNWAIYANAAGLLVFTNIPLANVVVPLLIALKVRKENAPLAQAHAKASFNFQATFLLVQIAMLVAFLLLVRFAVTAVSGVPPNLAIGFLGAYVVLMIFNAAMCIWGCARASDVRPFRYPLAIPFMR